MTEAKLRWRIRNAVRALALEFKVPLQQEASGRSTSTVDRLLSVWRSLSEEERAEFLRQANGDEQTGIP